MKLSAPVYRLRRKARNLARRENISLSRALDRVAAAEGFASWNLLASCHRTKSPSARLLDLLQPGEMLLLAARPGHGKTRLGLEVLDDATRRGRRAVFFSSEYTEKDLAGFCPAVRNSEAGRTGIETVLSDELSARTVTAFLAGDRGGPIAVVDYLQVLDQRRVSPELSEQVKTLKAFAGASGARLVVLSQVHRSYDPVRKLLPDWTDVRLPNPVDLSLFDRGCFLNDGRLAVYASP
ncbi:MAG: DNA helicase [Pseudomonadota bacterium]